MPNVMPYHDTHPTIGKRVFLAKGAHIIGAVTLGDDSSVFFNTVLRADINSIVIGERTNIQDNCTFHLASDRGIVVGSDVTIGHNVVLHACTVEDNVTIGMSATVMDNSHIARDSIVAAGTLVPPGKIYPPGVLIVGSPGRVVRQLSSDEIEANRSMAQKYVAVKNSYLG